jgi:hypothetical protein
MKLFSTQVIAIAVFLTTIVVFSCANTGLHKNNFDKKLMKVGKGPASIEAADFNGDGYSDLAVLNVLDSTLEILLNNGKGNFIESKGSPFYANLYPNDMALADFDNDGNLDIGIANSEVSQITVLLGNGKGQFKASKYSPIAVNSKPHTHGIAVADFNHDGNIDVTTESWAENSVLVLEGQGNGNFIQTAAFKVGQRPYQRLRSADVNLDGNSDIITTDLEGNTVTVLLGNGSGHFSQATHSPFPAGSAPFGVAIGDINGDKKPDIIIVNSPTITAESKGNDGVYVLLGDGSGNFARLKGSPFKTGKSPSRLALGDLDGNGINDIAITNYNDKSVTIFYMGNQGLISSQLVPVGNRPNGISISDFNRDGKKDMVVSNFDDNNVVFLFSPLK